MHQLRNGQRPQNVGAPMTVNQSIMESLIDHVTEHQQAELLAEYAEKEHGLLLVFTEGEREHLDLDKGVAGLVYWSEGTDEPDSGLRQLKQEEADLLLESFESVITNRVIKHYQQHPGDDKHPAYDLYQLHRARVEGTEGHLETD